MNPPATRYKRHRFPPEIIQYAVWLYHRFNLSHQDIEDLLARRGVAVSHESIRLWCNKFGPLYARQLRRRHRGYGDTFFIDEVFVRIQGKQRHLWSAVDQDGEVVDVLLQERRDAAAAKRFFGCLLARHAGEPRRIVSDNLSSCAVSNLFNLGRHRVAADHFRALRRGAFASWREVFGDRVIATAILDRVLHHAITINIRGNSYRLKDKLKAGLVRAEEPEAIN